MLDGGVGVEDWGLLGNVDIGRDGVTVAVLAEARVGWMNVSAVLTAEEEWIVVEQGSTVMKIGEVAMGSWVVEINVPPSKPTAIFLCAWLDISTLMPRIGMGAEVVEGRIESKEKVRVGPGIVRTSVTVGIAANSLVSVPSVMWTML